MDNRGASVALRNGRIADVQKARTKRSAALEEPLDVV